MVPAVVLTEDWGGGGGGGGCGDRSDGGSGGGGGGPDWMAETLRTAHFGGGVGGALIGGLVSLTASFFTTDRFNLLAISFWRSLNFGLWCSPFFSLYKQEDEI